MKNSKSSLTKVEIEQKLLPRLKFMSYVFFAMSLASLIFAFFVHGNNIPHLPIVINEASILSDIQTLSGASLFSDMQPLEIPAQDVLNFYVVALIFATIGILLYYFSSKKTDSQKLDIGQG